MKIIKEALLKKSDSYAHCYALFDDGCIYSRLYLLNCDGTKIPYSSWEFICTITEFNFIEKNFQKLFPLL